MGQESSAELSVNLWRRFGCMFYDGIALMAIWWGASLPFALIDLSVPGSMERLLYQLYLLGIGILYFVLCWHRKGATLGMRAWGVRIEGREGGAVSWSAALIRALGALFSAACLGLGYFWCLFSARRQCWHDVWSATTLKCAPSR